MKRFTLRNPARQHGASLLEVIAYLGIAAIVVLGAVSMLGSAFSSAQANRTIEEVVSIRTGIKRLYMGQSLAYGSASMTSQAINARILPTTLAVTGSDIKNAWNGAVAITGNTTSFTIKYSDVPRDACVTVLSGASGWSQIKVGTGATITSFPLAPAAADTACANGTNEIAWTST